MRVQDPMESKCMSITRSIQLVGFEWFALITDLKEVFELILIDHFMQQLADTMATIRVGVND